MAGDKFDQLYNALKADGAVSGTREHFRQFVYAPGKQGYHNRKQLYDALHADGAVSSNSYEEFAQRLGLHAVNPKPQQQKPVQPVKKLTMKQRAQEVAAKYRKPRQQKAQQPRTATTSGTDYMQNWRLMHMRNDQMNPMQQAQASNARARMQRAQEQSARQEQQRATPISRSRITPTAKNFNETMQQLSTPEAKQARAKQQREDDARAFAQYEVEGNRFLRNDGHAKGILGNDLLELVDSSMNEAQELTRQQYQQNLDEMGGIYAPQSVKEQAFRDAQTQEQVNRQNVLMNNLSSKINEIYSQKGMQRHIAESAEKLNMSVEEYVDKYVTPEIMNYAQKALTMRNQEEIMPHGALDYIAKNLSNSIIGMVVAPSVMSRDTRQRLQEGIAIADGDAEIQKVAGHKDETYRSGIGTRFASTAVNMAADSGPLAVIGAGASAAVNTGTRVLTNGLVKAGVMKAAQKLTAQQMAFKVANMTTAQKIMSGLGTRTATGALNLAGYSGVTAALNQASTGDDTSLQAIGEAGLKGAEHGAVTGAMFGVSGAIMSPWVSKFGITGMEKSTGERLLHGAQKFGATAAGLGVEAGTMMVADNVTGDKDISFGTWLEDVVMVGAFKAGEPSNFVKMGNILHHLTHNSGGNFVIGKNANGSPIAVDIRLTPDEKNELISSASGKNLMDAFVKVDRASKTAPRDPKYKTAYTDFMNDPDVSQSTKEKVNAAMGLFNTTRGKSYRSVNDVKNKQILEYTKNGTLLTRTSYKNADERRAILYKQKLYRDNDDMMSLMGYARMKDMQFIDDDGTVTNLAFRFLKENGYDENKDITDPNNARLINELRNQKSALYLDWEKYADKNGLLGYLRSESKGYTNNFMASIKELLGKEGSIVIDIDKIMRKDPMKRTDEENRIFYHVKRALEDELFPSWRPHADQSASQGKTVAEEHSLGTDNPDSGVVVDELRNLRNAEQALDAAMDSNDVFKQTFEKLHQQGLTPAQIYDALIQNGLLQEELTPLAQYINANARVQGMQQATADAIEENVKSFISDWSYHGTLNGQAMNGEQALYVQDSSGRTLLVGSGDVAFDQTTGKAKEGSGDMLVCMDPNTRELVFVKADDVTLFQNQPIDQFAAEYRQRLQMKNSEPYNQAAQEQAMQDAAKAQQEQEAPQDNTTLTKVDTTSGKDNTTNEDLAPQEQPQQESEGLKFKDGTTVPVDANGEPYFLKMTPEQGAEVYKMLFEEDAPMQIDSDIKTLEKDLENVKASKYEGASVMERAAARKKVKEAIALAEAQVEKAKAIKAAMEKKPEAENTSVGTAENAGQYEKERQLGYREGEGGVIYHRQKPEEVGGIRGKEVTVAFSPTEKVRGHVKLVELDTVQASHNNGQLNLLHFGPDWQPKDRSSQASRVEAEKIAGNIDPEQITGSNNAFIGSAPSVNERHETIQGNNRVDALKEMYASHPEQAAKYKQWLIDHAAEFGLNAEDIKKMKKPVIVNELPVDDATAKKLGQMMASGFESGGKRIPEISATINKLGDKMENLANVLLSEGTLGEDAKLSDLINQNSKRALEFLNKNGFIDNTEYENLATDVVTRRQWLESVLKASLFDGNKKTEAAFNTLPGNAQKAVLATFMRDRNSKDEDRIKENIQKSFEAYNELNQIAGFKNAKNLEQARAAIQAELLNGSNNMFGEAPIREKYTKFELELAALYKGLKDQKSLTGLFGKFYDAIQGKVGKELDAFSQENAEPLGKDEAIENVFGINNKQENDRRRETESPSESGGGNGSEPAGDRSAGAERPRVEEPDDLVNKELESRIKVTDEETETPSKNGPIMKQKIVIDGDKEVMKVDEPNEKGEYTGSYYEYDGKKFGDLKEVADYIDKHNATISERKQALLGRIASGTVKKKDEAWGMLADAEELLAEYYGIPYDEYGGRQRTKSTTIDLILNLYTKGILDKITNEPIPSATEKQIKYLMKLAKGEHLWESALEGMIPNKKQASWLIDAMKGLDDEYLLRMHPDEIEEREREIYKGIDLVRKANGADAYDWDGMRLLPKEENPDPTFDPIAAAAAEFKKEHPLTEDEIMKADVDDLSKDMALDYLNGEVTDDLHRAIYESIFAKTRGQKTEPKVKTPKAEPSADPMEGIKNAAEGFEKEKKAKAEQPKKPQQTADDEAVAASNKKVNDLWDMLKNAGKDEISASFIGLNSKQLEVLPKLVSAMAENAYLRIKRGMHNLEDVMKEMRKEFAPAAKLFKKEDVDAIYEQMMNIRYRDGEQRMSLKDWADYYEKTSPKHQENLVGDSKTAEERKLAEKKFIDAMNLQLAFKHKFNGIVELRKIAERVGLKDIKDTDLQELAETAIVKRARGIASSGSTNDAEKFKRIKTLYENQPSLNQRDSERVMKQQYSTPAPYAFLADMYVKGNGKVIESALEPSAGNGMLTIGLPMDKVHVNDIDAQRLANLRRQGFKNVTSQDGTQPFADKDVDVVVTNPPFGSATPKEYDGYKISSLEGQMAINALESMKDDGRAAIIIGGKTEYAKNGSLNPKDKAFLGYLYSHYNVEDVINVDGSLYAKQGTSYPTRIILINGRRLNENAFPPVKDKARAEAVKDYDELYKRIEDDILRGERMDSSIGGETRSAQSELDKQGATGTPKERVRAGERGGSKPDGERESDLFDSTSVSGTHDDLENQRGTEPRQDGELPNGDSRTDGTGTEPSPSKEPTTGTNEQRGNGSGGAGRNDAQPNADEPASTGSGSGPRGQLQRVDKSVRGLSTEKVTYTPKSGNPFTLKAVMPADQQEAVNKNLEKLGDADQFLVEELGYNDKDDLYSHLAAEQVDSVALALQQAKKGNAFIIGDMTGIGKGRQAASLIRYAKKQGQVPVYFTKTAGLLSDVYRDLVDIGSPDIRPFVFGSAKEAAITDSDGKVVFALPSKSEVKRVLDYIEKNGKLPDEYDYVLTTYSQVSNGVYEFDENGNRKERKLAKGKSFGAAALSGQKRRDAIEKLMGNAYLILDESHTAGGNSGQGNYFQHIIQKAKNVTFFSATFAKRPDNMPIYALRTAMNEGGMKSSDLIDAVKRGGATLQEIMSQTLTQCGQMIRRERDMTGVTIDWKAIDDPERVQEQREQYDSIIGLFNDIINFQKKYVSSYVDERNDELAAIQSTMGIKKGTAALGIKNQPFASKAFNTVQQVLLSLKAKSAAERAIDYLKQGMKPVIALNNTNESQTGNLALGEEMDAPDLGTSLKKGLEGTLRYTQKDAKDNSESGYIKLSDLGDEAVEAYHELEKKIEQTSTGLSLSPIDVIKNELQKAGYKVGELTGRQTEFVYNDNGTVTKVKRADTDKKKLARDFNDGKIDALILNKSAATGISLHASSKYKDQKKRVMIVAQQQLDVNDEVQMRGRIDRTGQVARGAYEYVVSLIPAEQRLLMMFKAKLKSLDANTTSSQKSKFNEMEVADITNKYGDKVVREYMAEHLDLYARMADPFGWEKSNGDDLSRIDPQTLVASGGGVGDGEAGADASKLLGRMALLRVSEQEKMLQEIGELYANEIQRLNEMGENDLEITELPLKAKTLHKEVWKQGAEPGGDNAFADNTYIEKVNMAILKKPMKASEVKASQDGLTGGKTWDEYKTDKKAAVKEYFDQKIADETQKYEERAVKAATKAKEKYIKDAKKGQKDSGMSDEQIEKMAGYQYDNIYKQEKDKLNDVVKNLKAKAEMFERVLDTFDTNQTFVLPTDMNNPNELSGFGNSYGRLIDIKITDNYSPNASSVSFATLDGRRKITFPIAGKVGSGENKVDIIGSIDRMTKQAAGMGDSHLRVLNQNFDNWDRLTSNESRKNGYIVTGNLMQALVDSKDQGLGGQLVKYTTDTGEVKTGILMPDRFDPKGLTTDAPINSVADKFELSSWHGGIDEVTSSDGEVKVKRIDNNRGNFYELRVPKSKAKGGKYFMDEDLLKLVNGNNFETRGNNMLAEFKPEQLKPVLDRLSKMGVKVQEERNTSEDEGTHFREEDPQEIELPKDEYAVLAHTIDSSHKNYKRGKVNYEYTADNFYVFKYNKYNDYNVYQKIPIDGNEELINYIKDGINKETIRNPRDIDSALEAGWNGRNGHYWDSTSNQEGRGGSVRPGEVSSLRSRHGRPSDERMGEELSDSPSSAVNNHIERIAQKTGGKVKMVSSVDEITNKAAKAAIEDGRKITGWYDEKTGEVHLYMPNIHDRYTAEKTIWHEVVGHKGMRELFGDERFDKFLREVWYDLDKPENAALKKLVDEERKFNPLNIYDAIEEGIARLAEDGKGEAGFWNGIKNKVSDFLHEIGYRIAPNTKDVKYLLWLSKNLQKNPNDPYWKLRAEAVKYRLDHERMPAVVAHDGMFYGNDGKVRSMDNLTKAEWNEATDGEIHFRTTPSAGTALDRYHRSLDEHGYMFTESYMDNMLSLKKLMNAIVPNKKIEDIASSENPYILQNTMQGAMSDAAQMFERNVMKPLDKAMAGVLDAFDGKKDDEKIRNFNLYMITKHGLERNREFFVRDFLKKMRMDEQKKQDADFLENSYYSDKEYLDNELKAGNIDLKEYYRQLDESIRNHFDADFEAGEHDYSGMHAIQEVAKSSDPYNDAEAIQSVMDSEAKMESIKKGAVKDYWDKVKAATQYSIDSDYKNGIISKELHGHVSNMFNWYVPLRKYDEATAEDTYGYITEQGDPKSYIESTIMRARGHKYLSETNVLAQIGAMGNRAIKNGGMNAIRQAFARFARNNSGNNLITETSVWYEKDPVVNIVYERYPDIPEDATADEINQIVSDFNKDMKMKESQGMAYKVYRRDKIGYKFQRAENKSQHIVDVKIAGRTHTFIINGNPRAAQALNGLLENSGAKGIMKPLSSISRMMAQLCTSYNPEFVMRNIMRDAEFASSNVTSKEGARYGALWAKYYAQLGLYKGASNISFKDLNGTTGLGLFAKYRNGTLDTSDKVQRYFKEFMENGGETGWIQIKNMQDWTKEYKKDVKSEKSKIDKGGAALRDFFFGNLANINEVAENIARFATYCASRDSNRSIIRSVYDAKEVSTNFNRHGSGDAIKSFKNGEMTGGKAAARWAYGFTASYLRHCSMFFNAGIQSTNLLVKNLKNHPVGTSINMLAIPFALGALAALGNNVLIASEDEKDRKGVKDPYGELPDYVRRNNLCIYKGGGQFVTIPLAIELRAFYGLGDLAAGLTFSPNVSGQKNPALDAVGCMSQLVPVMDYLGNSSAGKEPLNETIKAISPSALSPFVEWELNTDWKGAPIERRGDWNENSPAWQRAYKGVPDGYMAVNKWVNAQTNDVAKGNEDMLGNSFLDMVTNPSMLNHYIGGIGGGAATFTERAIGVIKHGKDTETKDIPFLRSLLYTPSEQSSLQRTKSKWYNYKDEMEKTMANVDRLKSKNVPIDKRIANIGEYFHFQNSKEAAKVRIIELAEKQMKRWKKLRDKSSDTESINFANQNIDRIMMDAVDELDRLE